MPTRQTKDRPKGARVSSVERTIQRMVKRIVKDFGPERVILFGSHARGTAGPDSDVDLLVVMPVEGSKHDQAVEILIALGKDRAKVPVDIVVSRPDEFRWRKEISGTIEHPAVHEGKVLYARR